MKYIVTTSLWFESESMRGVFDSQAEAERVAETFRTDIADLAHIYAVEPGAIYVDLLLPCRTIVFKQVPR